MKAFVSFLRSWTAFSLLFTSFALLSPRGAQAAADPFIVFPILETPQTLDTGDPVPRGVLQGDSDDPAIWVHPTNPQDSLVICTLKNGGLVVFDLEGRVRQLFAPEVYGAFRYNNVDLIYNYKL